MMRLFSLITFGSSSATAFSIDLPALVAFSSSVAMKSSDSVTATLRAMFGIAML